MSTQVSVNPFFNPTQISGCQLWLDASDRSSVVGTNPITSWADKSGTSRTVSFNGNIVYNPANNSVNTSNGTGATSTYFYANVNLKRSQVTYANVYIVHTFTGSSISADQALWGQDPGGGWNRFQLLSFTTTPSIAYGLSYTPTLPRVTLTSNLNTGATTLYSANYAYLVTNGTSASVNGSLATSLVTETAASPETTSSNTFFGTIDTGWSGRVAFHEILIYTSNLTTSQRQQIEGYLAWKWGLQANLPASHPYKTTILPPTLNPPTLLPSVAGNAFFSPTQIAGCALWLDGADRNSMVLSGVNVRQWNDKSGGGMNFVQQGTFALPVFVNNAISSQSAVSFTGNNIQNDSANQILTNSSFSLNSSASGYSIFTITLQNSSRPSYTGYNYIISAYAGGAGSGLFYGTESGGFLLTANGTAGPTFGFNDLTANVPNTTMTSTRLTGIVVSASVLTPYLNGTAMTNKTGTCVALTGISIGNAYAPGQTFTGQTWGGVIGEVLIYNAVLSTTQRQQVEGYLAWKWGLQSSLPATHPYKNSPIPPLLNPPVKPAVVVSSSWTPTQISQLGVWFDASDRSTLTLSGVSVTQWNDKSGNARNVSSAGGPPTYASLDKAVVFNGSQWLSSSAAQIINPTNGTWSVFCVASCTNPNNTQLVFDSDGPPYRVAQFIRFTTNTFQSIMFQASGANDAQGAFSPGTISANTKVIGGGVNDISVITSYLNGTAGTAVSHTANNTLPANVFSIGVNIEAGARYAYLTGNVYEIVFYSKAVSTTERQNVEGYLAWKWGLASSLPENHPFKRWPPSP